jgi:Plasmid pRiA4b ORF-3-like protein
MSSEVGYTLKVTLEGSNPPIWRRLQVPGSITLRKLHRVLQVVMGWQNCHLHEFVVGEERFGDPDPEDPATKDSGRTRLKQAVPEAGQSLMYLYDFGDGWRHEVEVEEIGPSADKAGSAVCLEGAGACPPEDCGGIYAYQEVRGGAGQENFDLDAVNVKLMRLR